jgi:hypothetical protein
MSELKEFFPPLWEHGVQVEDDPPPDSEADVIRWMRQLRQPTVEKGVSHLSCYALLNMLYIMHLPIQAIEYAML